MKFSTIRHIGKFQGPPSKPLDLMQVRPMILSIYRIIEAGSEQLKFRDVTNLKY